MGSFLRRAAFALRFGEWNLFVSNLITSESKILYVRDVIDRVKLLAPFLAFDTDPYPVVTNGQVKWVVDAYTATDRYPYAQMVDTSVLLPGSGLRMRFNYARNSIKAVVDAYDGSVKFYIVDENDPMAKAYQKAFPELFDADVGGRARPRRALPVPRGPVPGADVGVLPLPHRGPAAVLPAGQRVERGPEPAVHPEHDADRRPRPTPPGR